MELTRQHSEVSLAELKVFDSLKDIHVVFDVGARMEMDSSTVPCIVDYLELKPDATYHLFEPNKEFASKLREAIPGKENVTLNEFGLGDKEGYFLYNTGVQGFSGGDGYAGPDGEMLYVNTIPNYCKSKGIDKIDFLKIDTEGFDYRVIVGAKPMWDKIHYIQYEEWDVPEKFYELLEEHFDMEEIGFRNVLCTNKIWS